MHTRSDNSALGGFLYTVLQQVNVLHDYHNLKRTPPIEMLNNCLSSYFQFGNSYYPPMRSSIYRFILKLFQQETEPPNDGLSLEGEEPLASHIASIYRKENDAAVVLSNHAIPRAGLFPNSIFLYPQSVPFFLWEQTQVVILMKTLMRSHPDENPNILKMGKLQWMV